MDGWYLWTIFVLKSLAIFQSYDKERIAQYWGVNINLNGVYDNRWKGFYGIQFPVADYASWKTSDTMRLNVSTSKRDQD
jgi:hypothetical protein